MNSSEIFGYAAGIVTFIALWEYVRFILRGETKPSGATWWCWALSGALILPSLKASGAAHTIIVAMDYAVGPLVVAIFVTAKHGMGRWSVLEKFCVVGSLVGGFFWWKFNSPEAGFAINMAIDCLGAIPTIYKAFVKPKEENKIAWFIFTIGALLNIGAAGDNFWEGIYTTSLLLVDVIVFSLLIIPRRKTRS